MLIGLMMWLTGGIAMDSHAKNQHAEDNPGNESHGMHLFAGSRDGLEPDAGLIAEVGGGHLAKDELDKCTVDDRGRTRCRG